MLVLVSVLVLVLLALLLDPACAWALFPRRTELRAPSPAISGRERDSALALAALPSDAVGSALLKPAYPEAEAGRAGAAAYAASLDTPSQYPPTPSS